MEIWLTVLFLEKLPEADWVRPEVTANHAGLNHLTSRSSDLRRLQELGTLGLNKNRVVDLRAGFVLLTALREYNHIAESLRIFAQQMQVGLSGAGHKYT